MSDPATSRSARLDRALTELLTQAPELEAAAVVSFDGLAMASHLPLGMDEDRVAAMSAALLSLGEKAAAGLGRGDLSQVYVEGETGTVFLVSCQDEAVLVAVAAAGAKAGLMLYEVRRAAHDLGDVLRSGPVSVPEPEFDAQALADAEAAYQAYKATQEAYPVLSTAAGAPDPDIAVAQRPYLPEPSGDAGDAPRIPTGDQMPPLLVSDDAVDTLTATVVTSAPQTSEAWPNAVPHAS